MKHLLLGFLVLAPLSVFACDAGSITYLKFYRLDNGRQVELCQSKTISTYIYGKPGAAPELKFSVPNSEIRHMAQGGSGGQDYIILPNGKARYYLVTSWGAVAGYDYLDAVVGHKVVAHHQSVGKVQWSSIKPLYEYKEKEGGPDEDYP